MNALHLARGCGLGKVACRLVAAGTIVALVASAAAARSPADIAFERIKSEIRELKRLVFHLKQDERKLRTERDAVARHRANALQYANGGKMVAYRTGFVTLTRKFEQSPGQASLLQMNVPALDPGDFEPEPEELFEGGSVSDLVQYCRRQNVSLSYGSRAQVVVAELVRDLVRQADEQIGELDEKIEYFKSQNIAHTDLIGKLMLCQAHCHGCHSCCHHGYGYCGHAPVAVFDHPIAGLNSKAYDTLGIPRYKLYEASEGVATDGSRLNFLKESDAPKPARARKDRVVGTSEPAEIRTGTLRR